MTACIRKKILEQFHFSNKQLVQFWKLFNLQPNTKIQEIEPKKYRTQNKVQKQARRK